MKLRHLPTMLSALLREWLKLQVKLGLPVYFRQLPVTGTSTIPASGPILFAANHQNSFLDALIVTITQPREMHYLVRSDVFRKPWADRMLRMLNMLPVFRIRDGWHTLGNNAPTFARCVEIFRSGGAVLIFPEGNHSTLHRLRPLSRGFTKPIALALETDPAMPIHVIPVGLNFSHHTAFRAPAGVHYGKPIAVQEHIHDGVLDANSLRTALSDAMKELIVHIDDAHEAEAIAVKLKVEGADLTDPFATNERLRKIKLGEQFGEPG
ncbi:MAG: 1-acyl-sn-glycerol-3-phosphate acyltransferase, partial [Bacteroidota bacterium]